ncbi:MAG: hypothetical protein JWL95_1458 [Gemmatimonadetes bacterium]|nr:hypothetical protein [Gemmatimonadota bacterium]
MLGRCALVALLAVACSAAPSDEQALAAIRAARPASDTTTVVAKVWQDGPPWFSCAEVLSKLRSPVDSAVVRDPLANWRGLLLSEWGVVHDSAQGGVTEPGWCVVKLLPDSIRTRVGWAPFDGPPFPTGSTRRGWLVDVGKTRVVLRESARIRARDVADVEYVVGLKPNANGVALRARSDSSPRRAELRRQSGTWRMIDDQPIVEEAVR